MSCSMYELYGCKNRQEYLLMVSEEYCVESEFVFALADLLGPSEDFDGLINAVSDM